MEIKIAQMTPRNEDQNSSNDLRNGDQNSSNDPRNGDQNSSNDLEE